MAKKILISLEPEADTAPMIFAIAAHEKAYRISWILNENFNLKLKLDANFLVNSTKDEYSFDAFSQEVEQQICIKLIANKFGNINLNSKYKTTDFFLFIFCKDLLNEDFIKQIRNIDGILATYKVELDKGFQKIIKKL